MGIRLGLLLGIGFVIKLLLMPLAMHGDMVWAQYYPHLMVYKGIYDPYLYFSQNILPYFPEQKVFVYEPLTQIVLAAGQWLTKSWSSQLDVWMEAFKQGFIHRDLAPEQAFQVLSRGEMMRNLFLMKLPYLAFDLWAIYLIAVKMKLSESARRVALILWGLNPIMIYSTYAFGQFDIIPVSLTLAAVVAVQNKQFSKAMIFMGLATMFKKYTIILIGPTILLLSNHWKDWIRLSFWYLLPICAAIAPFALQSPAVWHTILQKKLASKWAGIGYHEAEQMVKSALFVLGTAVLSVKAFFHKPSEETATQFVILNGAILLLFYTFVSLKIHYFTWIMPFAIPFVAQHKPRQKWYWVLMALVVIYKLKRNSLAMGLFAPLNPEYFLNCLGPKEILQAILPWDAVIKVSKIGFMLISLKLVWSFAIRDKWRKHDHRANSCSLV